MTEIQQQQEEEREVLLSIYDGDPAFKHHSPTTFQYKVIIFSRRVSKHIYVGK
jgi:RWD domain.